MSLKLIELQVALPRTVEVGKIQEQLQQRGQQMQGQITAEMKKNDENKRKQVVKNKQKDPSKLQLNQSALQTVEASNERNREDTEHHQKEHHPFKGNFIDISG